MIPEEQAKALGLLYHLNSEPSSASYLASTPGSPTFKTVHGQWPAVDLPQPELESPLMRVIRAHQYCRAYRAGTLPLVELAEIVRGAYGIGESLPSIGLQILPRRAVPSAGACYPLELYVAASAVAGVENGLYHYDILDHRLLAMRQGDLRDEFCALLGCQTELRDACAVLIFAAVFDRTLKKYESARLPLRPSRSGARGPKRLPDR